MSEYLSKEEIKQWRSSLEKITLEEFAARLGKKVEEKKETNDLIDIVLHGQPVVSNEPEWNAKAERLSTIADRAYEKEKELYVSPFSAKNLKLDDISSKETETKTKDTVTKKVEKTAPIKSTKTKVSSAKKADKKLVKATKDIVDNTKTGDTLRDDVRVVFKKALTDREQKVFDYFAAHKNKIVYAKDLASLLDLPRDYVYKYIKNLRAKIEGESLKNADKGGFILSI
ncbi:TPA: helix-turn-helix domain-containing protein [Candidatus Gastranaerophilales bacterium HUM_6]|nr:helix-turn-helix domain-containing protein [Cyanobacteriota bacterium]CDE91466.1 unknown [Fusobacterium sp. CAG:815]DAA90118.1 MAG TPA: helix-turn-helix domain-containing protein [Candidatus Gastranaerophilales bacterium HUM_7]DAA93023.1 MAG TPA: helix-turn-helix domain-containing protein [Candidatus Gastranaerophilales bacterium HUM_6]DAB04975.1 MAG TPA: helix-turn-helix domain-containing protein [Candidatus Gastranaerophilales bacterium HUM_14]